MALVAALALAAALAPSAFAHAAFLESTPAPGVRLQDSPRQVTLEFTEPLIARLTEARLVEVESGRRLKAEASVSERRALVLSPADELKTGAYRVEWHTVSTEDGHALEGSFGFGVRADAVGGIQSVEESPLARSGWVRIGLRVLFYAALVFFAGGVFTAVLLGRGGDPAGWLLPSPIAEKLERAGLERPLLRERAWRRTVDAGWAAAAAAVAVALAEAADASGGLSLDGTGDFLLSSAAGFGRVGAVVAIALAAALAPRRPLPAGGLLVLAFASVALSGHANSAEPRVTAVASDLTHLLAASVWVGGIAHIAWTWLPLLRRAPGDLRREVMRAVLERFGRVALPAFAVVVLSGLTNALIQLGHPSALVETSYGLVLTAKISLVGLIALASYWHAVRLRPRLLAANPHSPGRLERRHWRLLRSEPALGVLAIAAAALLVAFPLPPRQLAEASGGAEGQPQAAACDPCPQREPRADELAVAENAGSVLVAGWIRRVGDGLEGEVRLFGLNLEPERGAARVSGARQRSCGPGCLRFRIDGRPATVDVSRRERGRIYTARLPARWVSGGDRRARRILERAQRTMRTLRSVRQYERVDSGPGAFAVVRFRLDAPNRMAYRTRTGGETIVIGRREWTKTADLPFWTQRQFGAGLPFSTRRWFRWTVYARSIRLLGVHREEGRRVAEVALMDHASPLWFRLWVDLSTMRVDRGRMIADGHFMTQRFSRFNEPLTIQPPPDADVRRGQ